MLGVIYAFLILLLRMLRFVRGEVFKKRKPCRQRSNWAFRIRNAITVYLYLGGRMLATLYAWGSINISCVVFGALSIGLGFGLQKIFNNFVSGRSFFLKRPIQVGDAIGSMGYGGVIQRLTSATVVKHTITLLCYSKLEIISGQGYNWSFKPPAAPTNHGAEFRMHRIRVGEATLLEIAANLPGFCLSRTRCAASMISGQRLFLNYGYGPRWWSAISTELRCALKSIGVSGCGHLDSFPQLDIISARSWNKSH
jgi:hypothetical protein